MPSRDGTAGRIKSHHTTAEYVRNYEAAGLAKPELDRYCQECGRLPAWCECPRRDIEDRFIDAALKQESWEKSQTLVLDARPMAKREK
jgi:hypothetical protein